MCKFLLKIINGTFLVLGLTLCGLLGYGMVTYKDIPGMLGLLACGVAVGVFVCFVSCLGFCGEKRVEQGKGCGKCMLFIYAIIVFILVVIQLAIAGVLVVFFGGNSDLKNAVENDPNAAKAVQEFGVFVNCTYNSCCGEMAIANNYNLSDIYTARCPNTEATKALLPGGQGSGKPATAKGGKGGLNKKEVEDSLAAGMKGLCKLLKDGKITNFADCKKPGGVNTFNQNVYNFFNKNVSLIGGVFIGLGVIQLIGFFGALFRICCVKTDDKKDGDDFGAGASGDFQQTDSAGNTSTAGNIAYGT